MRWYVRMAVVMLGGAGALGCGEPQTPNEPFFPWDLTAETNLRQTISGTLVRVDAYEAKQVVLGACASFEGNAMTTSCAAGSPAVDLAMKPDLNQSGFRHYSRVLAVSNTTDGNVGGASTSFNGSAKKMQFVMEWARWRSVVATSSSALPMVSAVDVGAGVRITFDVTASTSDGKLGAGFGFGSIATALATKSAAVEVRVQGLGVNSSLVPPNNFTSIATLEQYSEAMNSFYRAVRELSVAYEAYAKGAILGAAVKPVDDAATASDPRRSLLAVNSLPTDGSIFRPQILAYYVSNLVDDSAVDAIRFTRGYLDGANAIANRQTCSDHVGKQKLHRAFLGGMLKAYGTLASLRKCDDTRPSEQSATVARTQLEAVKFNVGGTP